MTLPIRIAFGEPKVESSVTLKNGIIHEVWHDTIDNEHHFHCPDGTLIVFQYEDHEGNVKILEGSDE